MNDKFIKPLMVSVLRKQNVTNHSSYTVYSEYPSLQIAYGNSLRMSGEKYIFLSLIAILLLTFITKLCASPKETYLAQAAALEEQGEYGQAEKLLQTLLLHYPTDSALIYKIGCLYSSLGKTAQALQIFTTLLTLSPENTVQTLYNIGYVLKSAGLVDQAIVEYQKVLAAAPDYEPAVFALGLAYLYKGDFANGWKQHEKYLVKARKNSPELRAMIAANNLHKKIILIRPDGGLGDFIQFIRYAKVLKALGAVVFVAAPPALIPLLSGCEYIDRLFSAQDPLPLCHDWCAVMSLPAVFNADEHTIPRDIPYLFPDPERSAYWKEYLKNDSNFTVGICWQASVHNDSSRPPCARRGMPLAQLLTLADRSHVTLYSLQQKDGLEQLSGNSTCPLVTFDSRFDTEHGAFMDTAALISHVDLVITVDTAIAHIAGALGAPVWLLLPYCTDWRWIAGRSDSPWYPTMRIFKQKTPFDWDYVMVEVKEALQQRIEQKKI